MQKIKKIFEVDNKMTVFDLDLFKKTKYVDYELNNLLAYNQFNTPHFIGVSDILYFKQCNDITRIKANFTIDNKSNIKFINANTVSENRIKKSDKQ